MASLGLFLDPPDTDPAASRDMDASILAFGTVGVASSTLSGELRVAFEFLNACDEFVVANERLQGAESLQIADSGFIDSFAFAQARFRVASHEMADLLERLDVPDTTVTPDAVNRLIHWLDSYRMAQSSEDPGIRFLASPMTRLAIRAATRLVDFRPYLDRPSTEVVRETVALLRSL